MAKKPKRNLTDEGVQLVAQRFKVLSEPGSAEAAYGAGRRRQNVTDLVRLTAQPQANVSKHLATLVHAGMVARRKEGLNAFYSISDPQIFELCDLMCHRLERECAQRKSPFSSQPEVR